MTTMVVIHLLLNARGTVCACKRERALQVRD
ncbi:MAG: hypothetical protein JWM42_896 [Burkholderia sp.]|nr:hypothetical protein [Burkholderia sp.]